MGSISVDQHNETRRAAKARQRRNRKRSDGDGDGSSVGGGPTLLDAAKKERAERRLREKRRQIREEKSRKNGERLLAIVNEQGLLTLKRPSLSDSDYEAADRRFELDMYDVRQAAKRSPVHYFWTETADAFYIGLPKKQGTR